MKVIELLELLKNVNPNADVMLNIDGSSFKTDDMHNIADYNKDGEADPFYYICADPDDC